MARRDGQLRAELGAAQAAAIAHAAQTAAHAAAQAQQKHATEAAELRERARADLGTWRPLDNIAHFSVFSFFSFLRELLFFAISSDVHYFAINFTLTIPSV